MESVLLGKERLALVRDSCITMSDGKWKVDPDLILAAGGFCGYQKVCITKEKSGFWKATYRCGIIQASEESEETMNDFYSRLTARCWEIVGNDMTAVFICFEAEEVLRCIACRNKCFGSDAKKKTDGVELFVGAVEENFSKKQEKNINEDATAKGMDDDTVIKLRESLIEMGFNDVQGE